MTGIEFGISALAAWRLAHMLVKENGPFDMFARLRLRAGIQQIVVSSPDGQPDVAYTAANWFAEGLLCIWCVSVWAAGMFVIASLLPYVAGVFALIAHILAISSAAILLQEFIAVLRGSE